MRKIGLIIVALSFVAAPLYSQVGFSLGVKGGINLSTINGDSPEDIYDTRTGFNAGAFVNLKIQRFGIQPEIMFSSQGSKLNINSTDLTDKFNYVNVPILIKFYPVEFLSLQAGPQFGFLLSADREGDPNFGDIESIYKDSDVSLALGVGIELPFGLNLEGRYNVGLSNISDNPDTYELLKNQVFQISIGFRFLDLPN